MLTKKTFFITAVKSAGFISSLIYDKIFHKKQGCRDEAFWSWKVFSRLLFPSQAIPSEQWLASTAIQFPRNSIRFASQQLRFWLVIARILSCNCFPFFSQFDSKYRVIRFELQDGLNRTSRQLHSNCAITAIELQGKRPWTTAKWQRNYVPKPLFSQLTHTQILAKSP